MSPEERQLLSRWLEAEQAETAEADGVLSTLMATLPRPEPAAGFAARVAARIRPAAVDVHLGVKRRALSALLAASALLASLLLTPWLMGPFVAAWASEGGLLTLLAAGVARASQLLVDLMLALDRAFELAQTFAATAARAPGLALGMLVVLALAGLAFWMLQRTLARERMVPHDLV